MLRARRTATRCNGSRALQGRRGTRGACSAPAERRPGATGRAPCKGGGELAEHAPRPPNGDPVQRVARPAREGESWHASPACRTRLFHPLPGASHFFCFAIPSGDFLRSKELTKKRRPEGDGRCATALRCSRPRAGPELAPQKTRGSDMRDRTPPAGAVLLGVPYGNQVQHHRGARATSAGNARPARVSGCYMGKALGAQKRGAP